MCTAAAPGCEALNLSIPTCLCWKSLVQEEAAEPATLYLELAKLGTGRYAISSPKAIVLDHASPLSSDAEDDWVWRQRAQGLSALPPVRCLQVVLSCRMSTSHHAEQ